jgi:hypothetical protein
VLKGSGDKMCILALALTIGLSSSVASAQSDISYGNFSLTELTTRFLLSPSANTVTGTTELKFQMLKAGQFFFNYDGKIQAASLDGKPMSASQIQRLTPVGARSKFQILQSFFQAGETHSLMVSFKVNPAQFRMKALGGTSTITFGTRYDNIEGAGPEEIMPSLNWPAAKPKLTVEMSFASSDEAKTHHAFCHCSLSPTQNGYVFSFNDTPTLQAFFYVVPVDANEPMKGINVNGVNVSIILSSDGFTDDQTRAKTFQDAEQTIRETFVKMESLFGKYRNGSDLTVYLFYPNGTSMEYRGAVQSTPILLRHELMHQWFATSISPIDYRDIWLNEAITVWLRKKMFNEDEPWSGDVPTLTEQSPAFNLAGSSALFEGYSTKAYTNGVAFMNLIDSILIRDSGGSLSLLPVIQEFYKLNVGKQIPASSFMQELMTKSRYPWQQLFQRQIYGNL